MLFTTLPFFVFLPAVLWVYHLQRGPRARALVLLGASYVFYAYWDWRFLALLALATLSDYSIARALGRTEEPGRRRRLLLLSVAIDLGVLGLFKYHDFFAPGFRALAGTLGLDATRWPLHVVLPLGISFYTFKTLSYVIDVHRRTLAPTRSLLDYALYVAFFPSLIAGPIDRAGALLPQFAALDRPSSRHVREGLALVALGLFKKVLIGDAAGRVVNEIFGQPHLYRSPELIAGLVLFSIQVYADFGGYSNVARGVARLFGVELMENFRQPYLSRSFSEFWRRWHISLSSWIWDYVFNPLLAAILRRVARWRLPSVEREMRIAYPLAAFTAMLLCGLWHGAGVAFVFWGGLHGAFLSLERLLVLGNRSVPLRPRLRGAGAVARALAGWASTQTLVLFAWLFFRAGDPARVYQWLDRVGHWQGSELTGRFALITATFAAMVLLLDLLEYVTESEFHLLRLRPAARAAVAAAALLVVVLYLVNNQPLPFVYSQF